MKSLIFIVLSVLFFFSCLSPAQTGPTITGFQVNGVSSGTGPVGATLDILGSGFGSTQGFSTATLSGIALAGNGVKPNKWTATDIQVVIPATASSGPVIVKVAGKSSNAVTFTIGIVITGVTPATALSGNSVTIMGQGFGTSGGTVTFNGVTATTTGWTDASIVAQVPNAATAGPIVVTVVGQVSNGFPFTPTPAITSLSPSSGLSGAQVTIAGNSFGPQSSTSAVSFNGVAASVTAWNDTSITATVPAGAQTGNVVVTVNGAASAGEVFTFTPQIAGLSPNSPLAGSTVQVQGSNFTNQQGNGTVTFNGTAANVTNWSNNTISATVPANVKPGPVVVTLNGVASNAFSYSLPALYRYSLGYAADGRVLSANDSVNGNWTYTYDDFGRLATSSNPQQGFSYNYDEYGNRWQQNVTAGQGGSDQLTFIGVASASTNGNCYHAAGQTNQPDGLCYDAGGNLLNDGSHTYTYDAENRLIAVDGGRTATYAYDADGLRIQGPNGQYLYDLQGRVITQLSSNGAWNYGEIFAGRSHLGTYSNSTTNFLYADWLGTKRVVVLPTGDVSQICTGFPFGDGVQCAGTGTTPSGFTDDVHDSETSLEHTWFRQYNAAQGRWISPDPGGIAAMDFSNPQSLNGYAYVTDNPINATDSRGLDELDLNQDPWGGLQVGGGGIWGPDLNCLLDENGNCIAQAGGSATLGPGHTIDGNDIFDAVMGAPGTFLSFDQHGSLGFGFDVGLWSTTENFIDQTSLRLDYLNYDPGLNVTLTLEPNFVTILNDYGALSTVTGFIPELINFQYQESRLLSNLPQAVQTQLENSPPQAWAQIWASHPELASQIPYWQMLQEQLANLEDDLSGFIITTPR